MDALLNPGPTVNWLAIFKNLIWLMLTKNGMSG